MKKNIILTLLVLLTINLFSQQYIVKFEVKNKKEAYKLPEFIQVDEFNNNIVTAYLYGENFEKFKKLGYKFKLQDHPAKGKALTMATTVAQMANWDRYPTFEVLNQMIDQFATDYPNICRVETIGTSEDGREIKVIKISDNPDVDEEEPEFYYTGQMHGDEIVAYIMFLRLADYMLSNYGTDSRVTNIINNTEIWINPLSNPDGTYNGGNNTVSNATRSNSNSVDLNRNFPSPNKPNPSNQNEAEVQMQIAFAQAHHFVMSANSHSGAEVINYPWDTWTSSHQHPDNDWWNHVSHNYADTVHQHSSGYMTGFDDGVTHGGDWYIVDGSRQDNMGYYQYCRELTLELSDAKMLDASLLPAHWNYNKSAMLGYIEECHYGFNGTVKNTNGDPLNAKIEITAHDLDNSEVYTDPAKGDYYRPISPGTYNVTYSSDGYISQTHSITITNYETTIIKNIILTQALQVNVTGTVTEDGTGSPLENATIEFVGTSIPTVQTDASGNYTVNNVYEGNYQIKAAKAGYTAVIKNETISTSNTTVDFTLAISNAISFETEIPSIFTFGGNADWTRVSSEAYDGTYSMKSGNISDSQTSVLQAQLNITSAGNISFYKKVSSENGYDKLRFYIDNVQQGDSWSGDVPWTQESFTVTTGTHTFKWVYSKDGTSSSGSDCAWVDYIEFPQYQLLENYTLTGIITDANSSNPIEGAIISIPSTSYSAVSIANGTYSIANVTEGTYDIKAVASGYKQSIQTVTISSTNHDNINFSLLVSNAESFETEIPSDYSFSGDANWTRENDKAYDGTWSMKSGNISDNQSSIMEVTKTTDAGIVSFYKFVSSENSSGWYDYLKFSIDGNMQGRWKGIDTQWSEATYSVTSGTHIYKWEYIKDGSVNGGDDCAWVDYIEFPTVSSSVANNISDNTQIKISPNPFNQNTSFEFYINKKSRVFIGIYSYNGQLVKTLMNNEVDSGNHRIIWDGTNANNRPLANGLYFCKMSNERHSKTEKIILLR